MTFKKVIRDMVGLEASLPADRARLLGELRVYLDSPRNSALREMLLQINGGGTVDDLIQVFAKDLPDD